MKTQPTVAALGAALLAAAVAAGAVGDAYGFDDSDSVFGSKGVSFTSVSGAHTAKKGGTIVLPCSVRRLGRLSVMWKRLSPSKPGDKLLLTVEKGVVRDKGRLRLVDGYNLQISRARSTDAGVYTCSVALTDRDLEQTQTLDIQYGPLIRTIPEDGRVIVEQGQNASMECRAHGNPKPRIRWRKKVHGVSGSVELRRGERLHLTTVTRSDAGLYECVARNVIGDTVSEAVSLQVLYKPKTEVERSTVYTGEGFKAQLVCFVHADPVAEVKWRRTNSPIDNSRVNMATDVMVGTRHLLTIDDVTLIDFDTYTCTATNSLGVSESKITLSGVADKVLVVSTPMGGDSESYDLAWEVVSHSPVIEYKIAYRKTKVNATSQRAGRWKEVLVPTTGREPENDIHFHQQVTLRDLTPATAYDVHLQAMNKHGWNRVSDTFHFSTIGRALGSRSLTSSAGTRTVLYGHLYVHLYFVLTGVVIRMAI